jgi:hypothetical protein
LYFEIGGKNLDLGNLPQYVDFIGYIWQEKILSLQKIPSIKAGNSIQTGAFFLKNTTRQHAQYNDGQTHLHLLQLESLQLPGGYHALQNSHHYRTQ